MNLFESSGSHLWRGLNLNDLDEDEAYLNVTSAFYDKLAAYSLSTNCAKCPFQHATEMYRIASSNIFRVSTKYNSFWRFYNNSDSEYKSVSDKEFLICEIDGNFGEFGVYDLIINKENCNLTVSKEPVNIFLPLFATIFGLLLLYGLARAGRSVLQYCCRCDEKTVTQNLESNPADDERATRRIRSIDTFRGFTLCLMIFVNDGAGKYWFLGHSTWNGLYPADVLFPWFLWIMGFCIAPSQKKLFKESVSTRNILKNILKRSCILFMLGIPLNTLGVGPINLNDLRIPGVLQRIAISYAVVSTISIFVWKLQNKIFLSFGYMALLLPQWLIHGFLLGAHYYLTFYLSVPGCPRGYLGAGGMQDDFQYENCTGGAAGYIDRLILGERRLWQNSPVRNVYHTLPFDPENILGYLTSIFGTFLGFQTGFAFFKLSKPVANFMCAIVWSFILLSLGLVLHYSDLIPLNKNLWSLSFVFATSGLALIMFILFYYVIDSAHLWDGSPFIYPGMNSLLVYVGHEVCFQLFPWHWKTTKMNTHFLHLIENSWAVVVWIVITYVLFRKRVFISV